MGLTEAGLDADRLAICGNRLLELVLPKQRIAEVGMSLSQVGPDPDRLAICGDRLVELALAHQRVAEPKLQSFLMSKTYLKSDHFNGGGSRGLLRRQPRKQQRLGCVPQRRPAHCSAKNKFGRSLPSPPAGAKCLCSNCHS